MGEELLERRLSAYAGDRSLEITGALAEAVIDAALRDGLTPEQVAAGMDGEADADDRRAVRALEEGDPLLADDHRRRAELRRRVAAQAGGVRRTTGYVSVSPSAPRAQRAQRAARAQRPRPAHLRRAPILGAEDGGGDGDDDPAPPPARRAGAPTSLSHPDELARIARAAAGPYLHGLIVDTATYHEPEAAPHAGRDADGGRGLMHRREEDLA